MGKVASDKCHKWVFKEPTECEPNISNYWQSSFDAVCNKIHTSMLLLLLFFFINDKNSNINSHTRIFIFEDPIDGIRTLIKESSFLNGDFTSPI
jgi:hypothetical protein